MSEHTPFLEIFPGRADLTAFSGGLDKVYVTDVQVEIPSGNVCAIVVPCPARFLGGFGRRDDFIIPWNCIKRIGPDIVLVEAKPDDCRVPRGKPGLPR